MVSLPLMYMMDHRYQHFDRVFVVVELIVYPIQTLQISTCHHLLCANASYNEFGNQNGQLLQTKDTMKIVTSIEMAIKRTRSIYELPPKMLTSLCFWIIIMDFEHIVLWTIATTNRYSNMMWQILTYEIFNFY